MEVTHAQLGDERLSITEAAKLAQVHPDTLRRAAHRGRVPSTRTPGGQFRFRRADIEALMSPVATPSSPEADGSASEDAA